MTTFLFPERFILFDTEFTSWEGSLVSCWNNPGQHREIIQIGAITVAGPDFEIVDEYQSLVRPVINRTLSPFIIDLTGVSQEQVDSARELPDVLPEFAVWAGDDLMYAYGSDGARLAENAWLLGIENPLAFARMRDVREILEQVGVDWSAYTSGTLPRAFGVESELPAHDALNDVKNMREGLRLMMKNT